MAVSRRTLIERIDRFIGSMEKVHREPDEWQCQSVLQALADIARGDMPHAEEMMIQARTAPEQRMAAGQPSGVSTSLSHPKVMELRAQLHSVKDVHPG